jgi:glycosyltransferase involved in cell wall biosynthesis
LALRTGIAATLIPNVMDYEHPPPEPLFSAAKVREELGLEAGELMILQPTRIVPRKGIEHAVELVHRLNRKAALVISHASGDEGDEYAQRVYDYARMLNVRVIFAGNIIEDRRRQSGQSMIYSLFDIYPHADLVTYPSLFEGFGNAFLEAMYFRKPIVINNYTIYSHDIKPKAFDVIEFDNYINDETMHQIEAVLDNPEKQREMGEANYERAIRHYSYKVLRTKLEDLLEDFFGSSGPKVCGNYQAF